MKILNIVEKYINEEKFSYTSVKIDDLKLKNDILTFGQKININDLFLKSGFGLEEIPHITLKYGLHTNVVNNVKDVILDSGINSINIKLGKISLFENSEFNVLKINVQSEELAILNKLLSNKLEVTDSYPTYIPHLTIAYLRPECGYSFKNLDRFDGITYSTDRVSFYDKNRNEFIIKLKKD